MEKSIELIDIISNKIDIKNIDAGMQSPLVLAYIGDAIYELIIRTYIVTNNEIQVEKLHKKTSDLVNAHAQSEIIKSLELNDEELAVFKRGRNAKSYTKAKNATMSDYRNATGFEALIGYLYLNGNTERMLELINLGMKNYVESQQMH